MNLSNRGSSNGAASTIWIVAGGLGIIFGGLLLATFTPALLPVQASAEAVQRDNLFRFLLAIGGGIFLLVQGILLVSVLRFRARKDDLSDGPPIKGNNTLEFVWTIIPAIIVFVLTIYSYQVWVDTTSAKPNEQEVGVVGARFAWTFSYNITPETLPADLDLAEAPENVLTSMNEGNLRFTSSQLHTWVNQPVVVRMQSQDVNHAFWVPAMRVKQDLLPGRTTDVRFTPIEPGVYRVVCAELCGSGHGAMAGTITPEGVLQGGWVIVHPDEETYIREFYRPNLELALFPPEDPALYGRQLLASNTYPCASCHVVDDLGWAGQIGPNLNNIGNRAETRVGGQSAVEYLHNSLRQPNLFIVPGYPANQMPQFNDEAGETNYMPEEDLQAIIAYLLTLKTN